MATKIITNWGGRLTRINNGDVNSGLTSDVETFGNDPFALPNTLTWAQQAIQIDPTGSVITDLIMDGKERIESGILYVYAIGHTGRLYKIQVNNPSTYNPDYDNPTLLATLSINSPTFTRGGSIDFFGATEQIYIGHDMGITSIHFDGGNEAFVGTLGSWTQTVPKPLRQFIGKIYVGNGANIAEIDSTGTVTTYTKLSPGFPTNTQVRDIDVSPYGNYLEAVVSRLALPDITSTSQDTTSTASSESYIFKWNGTDTGYTSYDTFPTFSLTANTMFGNYQYTFGYDNLGMAIFNPKQKIVTATQEIAPLPNAVTSNGNLVSWMAPLFFTDHLELTQGFFGPLDHEFGTGYWAQFGQLATAPETDIIQVPCQITVSNFGQGASSNGYVDNVFSTSKVYFSTLETSSAPTTKYRFYKWNPIFTSGGIAVQGVYQTQTETTFALFRSIISRKFKVNEVRFFISPLVANNSFLIDLIGSDGNPINGASFTFTAGSNVPIGQDWVKYNPQMAPTYALAVRITNLGTANWVGTKLEFDYEEAGTQ